MLQKGRFVKQEGGVRRHVRAPKPTDQLMGWWNGNIIFWLKPMGNGNYKCVHLPEAIKIVEAKGWDEWQTRFTL